jgi:hypothetical protein
VTACWLCDKFVSRDSGKAFAPFVEINKSYDPCNCCTTSAVFGADARHVSGLMSTAATASRP